MVGETGTVGERGDVAEARCQHCGKVYKSLRGKSVHERACKEKGAKDPRKKSEGKVVAEPPSSVAASELEDVDASADELTGPGDRKGGLKVDFRMPDSSIVSDASAEIKQLISQMEEERTRWEEERKKFLEQTESLGVDGDQYSGAKTSEPASVVARDVGDARLFEIAGALDDIEGEIGKKADVELVRELLEWKEEMAKQLNDLDENVTTLTTVLGEFSARTLDDLASLRKKLKVKADEGELDILKKKIRRMDGRLEGVLEEVGYREALDLSKIPPGILELVYQTTMDDVARALNKVLGHADAEKAILSAMEEVRLKTSGSEFFRYVSPRFKTKGLASSIEKGLISAKQVQMTYDELLKRMMEYIPRHTPKNFRALIKVKSQEFAVDRSNKLEKDMRKMEQEVQTLQESLAETSKNVEEKVSRIASQLNDMRKELESAPSTGRAEDSQESPDLESSDQPLSREEKIVRARFEYDTVEVETDTPSPLDEEGAYVQPSDEIEELVLTSIPSGGMSFTKLKKVLRPALPGNDPQSILDSLVEKGVIEKRPRGKGFVYFTKEVAEEEGSVPEDE